MAWMLNDNKINAAAYLIKESDKKIRNPIGRISLPAYFRHVGFSKIEVAGKNVVYRNLRKDGHEIARLFPENKVYGRFPAAAKANLNEWTLSTKNPSSMDRENCEFGGYYQDGLPHTRRVGFVGAVSKKHSGADYKKNGMFIKDIKFAAEESLQSLADINISERFPRAAHGWPLAICEFRMNINKHKDIFDYIKNHAKSEKNVLFDEISVVSLYFPELLKGSSKTLLFLERFQPPTERKKKIRDAVMEKIKSGGAAVLA